MYIKKSKNTQISKQRDLKRMNHKLYLHNLKTNTKNAYNKEKLNTLQWEKWGKLWRKLFARELTWWEVEKEEREREKWKMRS